MGVSTDAILFYGYCWDEEGELLGRGDGDDRPEWAEVVLRKRGVANPWDAYPNAEIGAIRGYQQQRAAGEAWVAAHRAELDAWDEARKAVEAEFGCEIGAHCSDGCPMPYVAVAGAGTS